MLPSTAALSRLSSIDTIIREVNPLPSLVLLLGRLITEFPPPQLLSPGSHPSTPVLERLIPPLHKSHNCRRQVYLQVPADLSTSSNTSIERLILTIGGTLSNVPNISVLLIKYSILVYPQLTAPALGRLIPSPSRPLRRQFIMPRNYV